MNFFEKILDKRLPIVYNISIVFSMINALMILSENMAVFQRAVGRCETVNTVFAVSYRSRIPERSRHENQYGIPGDPVTDPGFDRTP